MGNLSRRTAPATALLLLASCLSVSFDGRADRAYRAGDLEEAARAYQQVLDRSPGVPARRALSTAWP